MPSLHVKSHFSRRSARLSRFVQALASALVFCFYSANAIAAQPSIGINFQGGCSNGTPAVIAAGESAGVVPQTNWNTITDQMQTNGFVDNSGNNSGIDVFTFSDGVWSTNITDSPGNSRLMKGYLDTYNFDTSTVNVRALPTAFFQNNSYDVYVYFDGDNNETRRALYTIGNTTLTGIDQANTDFSGTFIESNAVTPGNYVRFRGLTSQSFTLSVTPDPTDTATTKRAPINAIQIVANTQVPLTFSQIAPISGTVAGGNQITLTGAGFLSGASVRFGSTNSSSVTVLDSNTIVAATPATGTLGSVDVTVTNQNNQSVTLSGGFTYASPQAISLNFVGGSSLHGTPIAMASGENAGFVSRYYWNNLPGASGSSNTVTDDTGSNSGATVTWSANSTWSTDVVDSPGNGRMMKGYLDTNSFSTVTVSNLPQYLFGANTYDVYVYFDGDNNESRQGRYTIGATSLAGTDLANSNFIGIFRESIQGGPGNYVHFRGLIGNSFTLIAAPTGALGESAPRAPINSIQIVSNAHQMPAIASITPTVGGLAGGTPVTIAGANFLSGATVFFGGVSATNVTVVSSNTITATIPPQPLPGKVSVTVTNANGDSVTIQNQFTYSQPDSIGIDFIGGGQPGAATAMSLGENAGVVARSNWNSFAGATGSASLVDNTGGATGASVNWASNNTWSTYLTDSPGNARMMKGYLDTSDFSTTTVAVSGLPAYIAGFNTYDVYVYIDGDNPETRTGVYTINQSTISATDFQNATFYGTFIPAINNQGNYVRFAGLSGSAFTLKATPIQAGGAGAHRAPVNGIQIVSITPAPLSLVSASPPLCSIAGGSNVTLTGTGFVNGANVTFGGLVSLGTTVVNSTTIAAIAPPHENGSVSVSVTNPNGQSVSLANAIAYTAPSGISINFIGGGPDGSPAPLDKSEAAGVIPKYYWNSLPGNTGSVHTLSDDTGGSTLAGISWNAYSTWSTGVGETPGNARMMKGYLDTANNTEVALTVINLPAFLTQSHYDVYVYFDGDNQETRRGIYTLSYGQQLMALSGTDSANVDFSGIFVKSTNGSPGNYVVFPGVTGSAFTLAAAPDPNDSANAKRSPVNAIQIVSPNQPLVLGSVAPANGGVTGGMSVTLNGTGFVSGAGVSFGGAASAAVTVLDSATISAVVPSHAAGTVDVTVNNPGGAAAMLAGSYTYAQPLALSVNFVGGSAVHGTPMVMGRAEFAGAISRDNWNSVAGASGTTGALIDDTGAVSNASVTWSADGTYSTGIPDAGGSTRMMKGYLDTINTPTTVAFAGLPGFLTATGAYDVYVYFDGDNSDARNAIFTIGTKTISATDAAAIDFSGAFTDASAGGTGNYVVFRNVFGSSFTLTAHGDPNDGANAHRAPVNGIQIVPAAPTIVPVLLGATAELANLQLVNLAFTLPMDPVTAANPANYSLSGGIAITGATLSADGMSVALALSANATANTTATANSTIQSASARNLANTTVTVSIHDAPPTITAAATATPPAINGSSTLLSVTATDDGGVANLRYTWQVIGTPPAPVTLSPDPNNPTDPSKAMATFTKAGVYQFQATVVDASGNKTVSPVNAVVNQSLNFSIAPANATVTTGNTQQFQVIMTDQFGSTVSQ